MEGAGGRFPECRPQTGDDPLVSEYERFLACGCTIGKDGNMMLFYFLIFACVFVILQNLRSNWCRFSGVIVQKRQEFGSYMISSRSPLFQNRWVVAFLLKFRAPPGRTDRLRTLGCRVFNPSRSERSPDFDEKTDSNAFTPEFFLDTRSFFK